MIKLSAIMHRVVPRRAFLNLPGRGHFRRTALTEAARDRCQGTAATEAARAPFRGTVPIEAVGDRFQTAALANPDGLYCRTIFLK